jgi:hypothetical protein
MVQCYILVELAAGVEDHLGRQFIDLMESEGYMRIIGEAQGVASLLPQGMYLAPKQTSPEIAILLARRLLKETGVHGRIAAFETESARFYNLYPVVTAPPIAQG